MKTSVITVMVSNSFCVVTLAHQSSCVAEEEDEEEDTQPSSPSLGTSSESRSQGSLRMTRSQTTPVKKSGIIGRT